MTAYSYEALDAETGKSRTGTVDADNEKSARSMLLAQRLIPVKLSDAVSLQAQGQVRLFARKRAMSPADLAIWTRQLAGLISAGLTVEKSLQSISEDAENPQSEALILDLVSKVKSGLSFSAALAAHPEQFSGVYRAVVGAGEKSGALGHVLAKLADEQEASQALKSKLLGAALYPLIVSAIAVLIVGFLMVYVVPQIAGVFSSTKKDLPILTVVMLSISRALVTYWYLVVLATMSVPLTLMAYRRNEKFQLKVDAFLLTLPLWGRLSRTYNGAQYAGTLGMLSGAGVNILDAMQAAGNTVSNRAMRQDLEMVKSMVREGAPIGLALARQPRFPRLISTFARMGAETGRMPEMLTRVAQQLSADVQRRAMQIATLLEPLLIVVMGALVGMIVLAVLMPIIQLNSFVH